MKFILAVLIIMSLLLNSVAAFCQGFKYGDVNGDLQSTSSDAALVIKKVLNSDEVFSDTQMKAALVSGDVTLTSTDAAFIIKKVLSGNFLFPVERQTETSTSGGSSADSETSTEKVTEATSEDNNTGVSAYGQLKVNGTNLCDKNGEPIMLKGMSSHGIAWFPDFVSTYSVKKTKEFGANLFRVAMYTEEYGGYTTGENEKNRAKELAYAAMDTAIENDMYVIIDWHILNDFNPQTHKSEAIEFFDEVSKKYANNPAVIYEICNEPHWVSWSNDIKPYAEEVIPVIRKNSPNAIVIVGTNTWSQDVDEASRDKLSFENVMYTLHFYAGTHYLDNFKGKIETALNNGCAIFATEWGTT